MKRLILLFVCLFFCGLALWGQGNPTIAPTSLPNGMVGTAYSQTLIASGGYGANGIYTFSLLSGALPAGLAFSGDDCTDCEVLSGTPTTAGTFTFTVQVVSSQPTGGPPLTGTQLYTIVIYPSVAITTVATNSGVVGVPYSQTFTATGGAGPSTYTWSMTDGLLPPGLAFSATGVLSGTPTVALTNVPSFTVQVSSQVPNFGTATAAAAFIVWIAQNPLTVTSSVGGGVVGTPYLAALSPAGGFGPGTYTFSLASGTLPPGITFLSDGTLAGTPTTAGTFAFTMQVGSNPPGYPNSLPLTIALPFQVVVYPSLAITGEPVASATVGAPYSQPFTASGGAGASSYTWSIVTGAPPPGLTLSNSGVLGGTPTNVGTYSFNVQVSSQIPGGGAVTAIQGFNITINAATSLAITGSAGNGVVGNPYSAVLGASGGYGAGTYAFSVVSGALPPGITLSAGGTLSGTPTAAGTSTFTVQVTSSQISSLAALPTLTATQPFTVMVYPSLAITGEPAASATVGVAYSQAFTASGGGGPSTYTWSVVTGALPPGMTFSAAGLLSGTPTTLGTFPFTVQVSSQVPTIGAVTATQEFSLAVTTASALTITGTLGGGTVGVPYAATLGATGGYGTGTYAFSLASGALPSSVTLSAGGALSGTPTAAGTFTFTVQVTSTLSSSTASLPPLTATQSFTVVIANALTISTASLPGGMVGTAYSQHLSATGGSTPYQWTVASGALPAGITLDATSGALSGTPTAPGSFTVTIRVTDARQQTATQLFTIAVAVPPAPSITISGLPDTAAPATQPVLTVTTSGTYPLAVQGTITLTFAPDSGPDDPNVQFTSGGRAATFQLPAGSMQVQFGGGSAPGVQTGTVAGTITLTLKLTAAGIDITPSPAPTVVLRVNAGAPVITSATVTTTSGGFNLVVVGYSTPRNMTSAAVTFTPAPGVTLTSNTATISLSQVFTTWYQDPTSAQYGSMFSLVIPFTIENGTSALTSVSITLTNSQGVSAAATAAY
ncbi:MAG: Ig domain-containing protein [Bryobacteraceae bacterium]